MKRKLLLKLGAPILALSIVAACGTADEEMEPVEEEEAPLNQEENGGGTDNGNDQGNGNGMNEGDNGAEDNPLEEDEEEMNGGQGNQ